MLVTGGLDALWARTVEAGADRLAAANVIANNVVGAGTDPGGVPAAELARLVDARDRLPRAAFDEAIAKLGEPGFSADPYLAQEAVSDTDELEPIVVRVLEANAAQVEAYRSGKEGLLGFFVGQVMKETRRQGKPACRLRARARAARRGRVTVTENQGDGQPRITVIVTGRAGDSHLR